MLSIYTSIFNLQNNLFNWQEALDNFSDFADEVIVATTTYKSYVSLSLLLDYSKRNKKVKIVNTKFSLDEYDFDGKLKNAALKRCSEEFCILLDADERVRVSDRYKWENLAYKLRFDDCDAYFIPVIDLFNSEDEYKSIGMKWYLHKNKPNIQRGVVDFAKLENGKIDINKSDTTELCYTDGSLVYTKATFNNRKFDYEEDIINNNIPIVYHLGWLEKETRLRQSAFWKPVWENRAGKEVKTENSLDELNKIEYFKHNFGTWKD